MSPPLQEGMLKDLQKSVEEEERVWKAKVGAAEEELQKVWLGYITASPIPTYTRVCARTHTHAHTLPTLDESSLL